MRPLGVIVTGAGGFLGRQMVDSLKENGVPCLPVSRRSDLFQREGCIVESSHEWADIDFNALGFSGSSLVHCAGVAHTRIDSFSSAREAFCVNVTSLKGLLLAAKRSGIRRFIYLSSASVYGESSNELLQESMSPSPSSYLGKTKLRAESLVEEFCRSVGMDYVVLRLPLVYAKSPPGNLGLLNKFIRNGYPLPYGSSKCGARSYIGISRLISVIQVILEDNGTIQKVFNVADEVPYTIYDISLKLASLNSVPLKRNFLVDVISGFFVDWFLGFLPKIRKIYGAQVLSTQEISDYISKFQLERADQYDRQNDRDSS